MSITADTPLASSPETPGPAPRARPGLLVRVLKAAASLRLTVVLFVLSFFLVFLGTLAQIDYGIGTVTKSYFRSWFTFIPLQLFVQFGQKFFGVPEWCRLGGSFPYPAGLTLGVLLTLNLLAAHAIRFKLSWRRSGIIILHGGLILLLLAEFITHGFAVEGRMIIEEGETTGTVFNLNRPELAVIDSSGPKDDQVTSVPVSMLRASATISDDDLPFDIVPVKYMPNSRLLDPRPGLENPATEGVGLTLIAEARSETAGTASEQTVDAPACYVKLVDKKTGDSLGTHLLVAVPPQVQDRFSDKVTVEGKTYRVALRFRPSARPFTLSLKKFSYDRYPFTDKAHNFSSLVRLQDPEYGIDEEILIRMNEPLRHRGETFFQADWNKDTERGTVLQVVRNPGWQLPYWSCVIVSVGLILHFSIVLAAFLQKRGA